MGDLRSVQCVFAAALVRQDDEVLLVRSSRRGEAPGHWSLPGDRVRHGEHPRQSAARGVQSVLAQQARTCRIRDALSDLRRVSRRRENRHTVRLVFETELSGEPCVGGHARRTLGLRPREGRGMTGGKRWARMVPREELPELQLSEFTARTLGVLTDGEASRGLSAPGALRVRDVWKTADGSHGSKNALPRVQRVGSYAVILSEGALLLSRFAGNGRWSLPGGGVEYGEEPLAALHREVLEETGLQVTDTELRDIDSAHFTGQAPSGRVEDYHVVRILYAAHVHGKPQPRVTEIGGTTDDAAWVDLSELGDFPLSRAVDQALRQLGVRST